MILELMPQGNLQDHLRKASASTPIPVSSKDLIKWAYQGEASLICFSGICVDFSLSHSCLRTAQCSISCINAFQFSVACGMQHLLLTEWCSISCINPFQFSVAWRMQQLSLTVRCSISCMNPFQFSVACGMQHLSLTVCCNISFFNPFLCSCLWNATFVTDCVVQHLMF